MQPRGFTLVGTLTTCTLIAALAAVALPVGQQWLAKSRRGDAVAALGRLQAAQEQHRARHGLYAADLQALRLAATSDQGLYRLSVQPLGDQAYRAVAEPPLGGPQTADRACPKLVLEVTLGAAVRGPSARCWGP